MYVQRLTVKNIRLHTESTINLSSDTTVIIGKNGVGKTSLLEAIYVALRGNSFKGTDADILRYDAPWYHIDILLDDDTVRSVSYDPSRTSGKKRFVVHSKTSYRLSPRDKYPVVLFEPEDLRLLHGSPSRRRQFIDQFILQIDPSYITTLRKYERALKQRNTLLKKDIIRNEDLFIWNIALSQYGSEIVDKRIYAIETLNKEISKHYNAISHTDDMVAIHYSHTSIDNSAQKLLRELEFSAEKDKHLAHTSVGPHRHDIIFHLNNHQALSVASRGEIRTIVLALKLQEIHMIHTLTGVKPFVLLDDMFSELDKDRQKGVEEALKGHQAIITSTHALGSQKDIKHIEL